MVSIKNPAQWASAFLGAEGFPDSKTDVDNIVGWETKEGGAGPQFWPGNDNDDNYNPISVSGFAKGDVFNPDGKEYPGVVATNSSGIDSFTSWQQGIDATVEFLNAGNDGYPQILADLEDSAPWSKFSQDVSSSAGWPNDLDYSSPPGTPGSTPNAAAYSIGSNATVDNGSVANDPSKSTKAQSLTGMAGILQQLDQWYNPTGKGGWSLDPITDIDNIGSSVSNAMIMIATRSISAVMSIGLILIGIHTLTSGGSGSGSPSNVLEFVNDAKVTNTRLAQSSERIASRDYAESEKTYRAKVNQTHESFRHTTPPGSNARPPRPRRQKRV